MRIVYYTHPAFLEPCLELVRELAPEVELHLMLEVAPSAWRSGAFDLRPPAVGPGLVPADPLLAPAFPPAVREAWRRAASFQLVVHRAPQSLHPASVAVGRDVLRFIRAVRADLVHIDDTDVSPRLALVSPGLRRWPVVVNVHDPVPHLGEAGWRKTLARRLLYRRANRFVVFGDCFRRPLARRAGVSLAHVRSIHLAPYGVVGAWADGPAEQEERLVLLFGRLGAYKGIDTLVAAARLAAERVPGLRLVVAGRPLPGFRPSEPVPLANGGTVELRLGYLPPAELVRLVRRATIVVCPYRDASQSGVLLTAFGLGRTVIATTAGALPEYVRPGVDGLLVPPGDAAALADAMSALLTDPAARRRLEAGVREPGRPGWRAAAADLLAIYSELARA
ncbi:MAG TPA: glycosyltransferase family 4 protein [Candidatus Limnocylindrales bacterium]